MSLFKNLFQSNASEDIKPNLNWNLLDDISLLAEIKKASNSKPVLIFKHSTRCGVSRMALKNFEKSYDIESEMLDLYFLDLLQFRDISNEIISVFNIQHQSPQAIVIYKEKVVYHDSHYGISVDEIKKAI